MSFFGLFRRDGRPVHQITDEEREASAEVRRLNSELRAIEKQKTLAEKKAEIAEIKQELREERGYGEERSSHKPEDVFFEKAITHIFSKGKGQQEQQEQQGPPEDLIPLPKFSDEEIEGIIAEFVPKKYKLLAKVISEENIKLIILNLDESGILDEATALRIARRLKQ